MFSNFEYGEFLYDYELTLFLYSNSKMINKKFEIKNIYKNIQNINDIEKNQIEIKAINYEFDEEENITKNIVSKKGLIDDFKFSISGGTIAIGSIIGGSFMSIASLGIITSAFGFLGGLYMIGKNNQNYKEEKNKYKDIKNQLLEDLNIRDIIIFEIKEYNKNKFKYIKKFFE